MEKKSFLIVIPARYDSSRLPGKPLKLIKGIPMIIRTFNQCNKVTSKENILVATDSLKIIDICLKYKIPAILTSKRCKTGTDRVAEVAKKIKKNFYINVQGDEPLISPSDIKKIIKKTISLKNYVVNGYAPIDKGVMFFNANIPKLIFDQKDNLLYMSRAPIPLNKDKKFIKGFRQICVYGFNRTHLLLFSSQKKKTYFEQVEDIEILRFLELGIKVKMTKLSKASISVDTPKDLKKVKRLI